MMKLKIGICDDNEAWLCQVQEIFLEYQQRCNDSIELVEFHNQEELLSYISDTEKTPLQILFQDVDMGEEAMENGISLAGKVNEACPSCKIVYLTEYISYATEVYDTVHAYYVLKEQFRERVYHVLNKIKDMILHENELTVLNTTTGMVRLKYYDILYFERSLRLTNVVTTVGTYKIRQSISEIYEKVKDRDFVCCHTSYIANLFRSMEITKNSIIMDDGVEIPISRSHKAKVLEAYTGWAAKYFLN